MPNSSDIKGKVKAIEAKNKWLIIEPDKNSIVTVNLSYQRSERFTHNTPQSLKRDFQKLIVSKSANPYFSISERVKKTSSGLRNFLGNYPI